MNTVEFSNADKQAIVEKVKRYFTEKLDQDIGGFDAEFLVEFFAEEVGPYFYNRGLLDAQALIAAKIEDLSEAIYELEKPL